jgi:hypothetical protein
MENLSRNEVIAIFALGFAIIGTLAAALAVQKAWIRFLLTLLTFALALTFYIYLEKSIRDGKSSRELSKEEMVQEAKRVVAKEQAERDEAFKEARERLERERIEREGAERAAREALDRDKAEQEARQIIVQEDAVKKLREQTEREEAEEARKRAEKSIIGKWKVDWGIDIEFTNDGQITGGFLYTTTYRVVDATHVELTNWASTRVNPFELSGDTLVFMGRTYIRVK